MILVKCDKGFVLGYKKNVDFFRLRYLRHRQTPYNHIRVKAHALA